MKKAIRLYTYDTDQCYTAGKKHWKSAQKREGEVITTYPSRSYRSFTSLKQAKKAAKIESREWYYLTSFEISMETITNMFDVLYGGDGPPCKIRKVHAVVERQ